jgi:predicted nucleic-acid-binding protein
MSTILGADAGRIGLLMVSFQARIQNNLAHTSASVFLTNGLIRGVWRRALRAFASSNADFADCLIERSCDNAKCTYMATFDAKAAKTAGMRLID